MTTLVHLRIPDQLYKQAQELCETNGFSSTQDFIRDALRKSVEQYQIVQGLKALQGSANTLPANVDAQEAYQKLINTATSELLRKYDLQNNSKLT